MLIRSSAGEAATLYLDLLKKCLTDTLRRTPEAVQREAPAHAETMVSLARLENIQFCIEDALAAGVPGDLIETGVWRGGATILMRAVLRAHAVSDRCVWVADSFRGLPPPKADRYPADAGDVHFQYDNLRISPDQVRENFRRYDLLDDQVRFLEGWFQDTLPTAPIERLAVLRLDGDMYESTIVALESLYDRLAPGGYVIVDDYSLPPCRRAIEDFRRDRDIQDPILNVDWTAVFWRRHDGMPPPPGVAADVWVRQRRAAMLLCEEGVRMLEAGDFAGGRRRLDQSLRRCADLSDVRWLLARLDVMGVLAG